jgi:response regulator of citrate/malate metabolism
MKRTILVVDDDESFKKLLSIRLRAVAGDTGIKLFDTLSEIRIYLKERDPHDIDLVVLDQNLPDGRGVEFLNEGLLKNIAVILISSDEAPEIPAASLLAGAMYFLTKKRISEPLFKPLIEAIISRNKLQNDLREKELKLAGIDKIRTMIATLKHEVNNPLGAVFGAAYLLKADKLSKDEQHEVAKLVESSSRRIKQVLEELCEAAELEPVSKANQKVFHLPGDKPWEG